MNKGKYLTDYLKNNAKKIGLKKALICQDKTLNWSELYADSNNIESFLRKHFGDTGKQHVIAIILPNSWQFVVIYYGIISSGHMAMPIDVSFKKLEIDNIINTTKPSLIITDHKHRNYFSSSIKSIIVDDLYRKKFRPVSYKNEFLPPEQQISTLFYASGTTGNPKVIPNTHYNQLWDIESIAKPMGWTGNDTIFIPLPLSHRHGLVIGLLGSLFHGNTVFLQNFFNPDSALELLDSGKISMFLGVPAIYKKLMDHNPEKYYDLNKVRLFESGSSHLSPLLWQEFKDRFGAEIFDRYGTSETGTIALNTLSERSPGVFGCLPKGVKIRIENNEELSTKSPGLFPGYYKNEKATKANFASDGWWRSGDIFLKENNKLKLKSRIQEKIMKNGYLVNPRDVEWAMLQNSKIKEIYVTGLQNKESLNDKILFFIVSDMSNREIQEYYKKNLPASWRPDTVFLISNIPKTLTGKPSLAKLMSMVNVG
ncbi:MAG: class I adenylate-forming enzyme family protein [Patescibacteria group bacterium]